MIGIGIEPAHETLSLMVKIAFDGEQRLIGGGGVDRRLQGAAELARHGVLAEVGDMPHHPGHGQAVVRAAVGRVVAAVPIRIGDDGAAADFIEGNLHRVVRNAGRNRNANADALRKMDRPGQRLHAAHRTADDSEQLRNAQMFDQFCLHRHHVARR